MLYIENTFALSEDEAIGMNLLPVSPSIWPFAIYQGPVEGPVGQTWIEHLRIQIQKGVTHNPTGEFWIVFDKDGKISLWIDSVTMEIMPTGVWPL